MTQDLQLFGGFENETNRHSHWFHISHAVYDMKMKGNVVCIAFHKFLSMIGMQLTLLYAVWNSKWVLTYFPGCINSRHGFIAQIWVLTSPGQLHCNDPPARSTPQKPQRKKIGKLYSPSIRKTITGWPGCWSCISIYQNHLLQLIYWSIMEWFSCVFIWHTMYRSSFNIHKNKVIKKMLRF